MWLRANIVLVVAVLFALVQMFASATTTSRRESPSTVMSTIAHNLPGSTIAQADNGGDNGSNDNSGDNSSADNSDNSGSGDNSDNSNGGDNSDNSGSGDNSDNSNGGDNADNSGSDSGDNGGSNPDADVVIDNVEPSATSTATGTGAATTAPAASAPAASAAATTTPTTATGAVTPPSSSSVANAANALPPGSGAASVAASPSPAAQPVSQVSATTSGVDTPLSLNNGRVTVQLFAALPTGLTVTLRMVDPLAYPTTPGIRAGDLIFQIDAKDETGATLTTLPSEVNITVHYNDPDVVGLTEANITMGHLDEAASQWTAVPNFVADVAGNTVSASTTDLGVFAVYVP